MALIIKLDAFMSLYIKPYSCIFFIIRPTWVIINFVNSELNFYVILSNLWSGSPSTIYNSKYKFYVSWKVEIRLLIDLHFYLVKCNKAYFSFLICSTLFSSLKEDFEIAFYK